MIALRKWIIAASARNMKTRIITTALVLLSLTLACASTRSETQSKVSVAVVPNISDLDNVGRAIFSPDGQLVATLDGYFVRRIKLWDIASGRPLRTLEYEAYFNAVAFPPNGKWIASAHKDGKINLWDVTTGAITATVQPKSQAQRSGDADAIWSLWIDAKGELLVSGSDAGIITVWSVAKREQLHSFKFGQVPDGINRSILAVRLTADSTKVIAITEASVKVFDARSGKEVAAFDLPNKYPWWGSKERHFFSKDSIIGDDELIILHSAPSCEIAELMFLSVKDTKNFVSIDKPASCEKLKDDDSFGEPTIFTSSSQPSVIIARSGIPELKQWDPQTRRVTRTIKWPDPTSAKIVGLDRNFRLAMSQDADKLHILEFESGTSVHELTGYAYWADNAVASKDGRHILLSHDPSRAEPKQKTIALWQVDALSPKSVQLAADQETRIRDFVPGTDLALASNEKGEIILFSTKTGKEQRRYSVAGIKGIWEARLSPDGKLVALAGSDASEKAVAVLIDASDGTVKHRFAGRDERNGMMASTGRNDESDLVTAVAFSADGRNVAVGRWNGTAEIWNTQTVRRIKMLPASRKDADQIWSLAFSVDGRQLIAGSRNSGAFLWDVATERLVRTFLYEGLAGHVHIASVTLSHDRKLVAGGLAQHAVSSGDTGAEHSIKVWNAATGKLRFTLRGHDGGIGALAFSSDDRWIVSGSFDGTIKYWNSTTGKSVATFTATRDGRWVVITESGLFAGAPGSDDFVNVVRGLKALPVSQFRDRLYRPDLVEQLLKGDHERRYSATAQQLNLEQMWDANSSLPKFEVPPR